MSVSASPKIIFSSKPPIAGCWRGPRVRVPVRGDADALNGVIVILSRRRRRSRRRSAVGRSKDPLPDNPERAAVSQHGKHAGGPSTVLRDYGFAYAAEPALSEAEGAAQDDKSSIRDKS